MALSLQVVAELANGGFIITYPGLDDGLKLAGPAVEINLRQVVTHFERNFTISECLHDQGSCPFNNSCPVRCRWARLQAFILQVRGNTIFGKLAREAALAENLVPLSTGQI